MMFFRVKLENAMPSFCVNTHLPVSQVTAIDVIDHEFLTRVSLEILHAHRLAWECPTMQLTHVFSLHRKYATLFYVPLVITTV